MQHHSVIDRNDDSVEKPLNFLPDSAFDEDYLDIDRAQNVLVTKLSTKDKMKSGWKYVKNVIGADLATSGPLDLSGLSGEVFESTKPKYSLKSKHSHQRLPELSSDGMLEDSRIFHERYSSNLNTDVSETSSENFRAIRDTPFNVFGGASNYGSVATSAAVYQGSGKRTHGSISAITPAKYNLTYANFQFEDDGRGNTTSSSEENGTISQEA